jgi:hypothetical protein
MSRADCGLFHRRERRNGSVEDAWDKALADDARETKPLSGGQRSGGV